MKKLFLTVCLIAITSISFGQNPLDVGQKQLNVGVGLSSWGIPVYGGMDFGVHEDITVGGEVGFRSHTTRSFGNRYNHSIISFSANANYHFNRILEIPEEFNLYAGLNAGFYVWNSPNGYGGSQTSGIGLGLQLGGRYYFTDRWGINLEFGGTQNFGGGKLGVSYKL